jgi:repressor LexA
MPAATTNPKETLLTFLRNQEAGGSPPPSLREVCRELGYQSTNAAMKLIQRLLESGDVIYESGRSRSLRLAKKPMTGIPLYGSITAGFPDGSGQDIPENLHLDPATFGITKPEDGFALRVRGDSMTGRQFFDGDLVLLDRSATPKHQDVVAALIDQECTLKTLHMKNGRTWLKAENPAYPDLIPAQDLQIQGVAKAVIRILAA